MRLWDRLRKTTSSVRDLRRSYGPNSYFQYKGRREQERRDAERSREHAKDAADREHEETERERGYEERYTAEREHDRGRERTEGAEEAEPDR